MEKLGCEMLDWMWERIESGLTALGFLFLISLILIITVHDIVRLY